MKQLKLTIQLTVLMSMVGARAMAYDEEIDGIYYDFYGDEARVTYGDYSYHGDVKIPSSVTRTIGIFPFIDTDTLKVTGIEDNAFDGSTDLTSVIIPNSVISIGFRAFAECTALKSITIPNSVKKIEDKVFFGCTNLKSIIIPNSVRTIGWQVFWGTAWYNNQPDGLVYAGKVAYRYKGKMPNNTNITIKEGTLEIASFAFYGCTNLKSIIIPNSVTSIGSSTFDGTTWYNNQPNGLVYAGKVAYKYKGTMPKNTSITIKEGTLGIARSAFYECTNLKSVIIPNSVTSIGKSAFKGCGSLTSVTIGNSVTYIGDDAFYNCANLLKIICLGANAPQCGLNVFEGVDTYKCIVSIPENNYENYVSAKTWRYFSDVRNKKYINGFLDTADVQYKKSFRLDGKNYTMYFVELGKAHNDEKDVVNEIIFMPEDFNHIYVPGAGNIPPQVDEVVYHDLGDPENKDFCSVVLGERICDKNGKNSKNIRREVIIPEDIANDIIDLFNGDTEFRIKGYFAKALKVTNTSKLRTFK